MDLGLAGKVAVVTGGSRGIGKAVGRTLAVEGADVALVARGREALEAAAREIASETGRRVLPVVADTTSDESVRAMVRTVIGELDGMDILVNAAARPGGGGPPPQLAEITVEAFDDEMHTKVLGYLRCVREVVPSMTERGWGRIVNVSGSAARTTGTILGSIRNVAVVALTKNLSDELGPKGIGVTCVHPAMTWTERMPDLLAAQARREGISVEQAERKIAAPSAVGRMMRADEVADVIVFLCSPRAVAVNGDVVAAGGGWGRSIYY